MKGKEIVKLLGWAGLINGYIMFVYIFMMAYLSSGKITNVDINYYGEANLELIVTIIMLPCIIYVAYDYLRLTKNKLIEVV